MQPADAPCETPKASQEALEHTEWLCKIVLRVCRLPWPEGTVIFDVAPADAHAVAAAALKAADAHVPRACLLRRVVAEYGARPSFQPALAAGGLRGDRLSVWALQVSAFGYASLFTMAVTYT